MLIKGESPCTRRRRGRAVRIVFWSPGNSVVISRRWVSPTELGRYKTEKDREKLALGIISRPKKVFSTPD